MSEKVTNDTESSESKAPDNVAIEGKLPLTAIDIESEKDMKSARGHPLRDLHKWFAARPTPAARLAVLASTYPDDIDADKLLKLMQIGPKALESDIADFVEGKYEEKRTSGGLDDHYGYPNPNTQSPTASQVEQLHKSVKEGWGGESPTIIDPTAGRGIIPFEAMRYGYSAKVNELNPVPSLIVKTALEYTAEVGSIESEIYEWRDKIHSTAKKNIQPYYPTEEAGNEILNSACTYLIDCDSCGGQIPLVGKWWINQRSGEGDAVRPIYQDGEVSYEHIKVPEEVPKEEFDPADGPVKNRDAKCPHCGVPTQNEEVKSKLSEGEFEYTVYGVNYKTEEGDW
jgi:adenine-specific DNA methylase